MHSKICQYTGLIFASLASSPLNSGGNSALLRGHPLYRRCREVKIEFRGGFGHGKAAGNQLRSFKRPREQARRPNFKVHGQHGQHGPFICLRNTGLGSEHSSGNLMELVFQRLHLTIRDTAWLSLVRFVSSRPLGPAFLLFDRELL